MTKRIYLVNKICCINCKSEIKICNFEKHIKGVSCNKGGTRVNLTKSSVSSIGDTCQFCGVENHNKNSLIQHQLRCTKNPDKLIMSKSRKGKKTGRKGYNQFSKARLLGLPVPIVSLETRQKLSNINHKKTWTIEQREKFKRIMKQVVIDNPESYCAGNQGRVKTYEIDGMKLKGKWEVKFYLWCKQHNIIAERPLTGFEYEWNGTRLYFPDFYLPAFDLYVEVKGFETDRDQAKWSAFPHKLGIVRKNEIKQIENDLFNIESIM
jgi:hypothetical protein